MNNSRAKVVLIGDNVHVAGNKDQWGRGGETISNQGQSTMIAGASKKPVYGIVEFEQQGDTAIVTGKIEGLTENTQHGFHIHEFGDVTNVIKLLALIEIRHVVCVSRDVHQLELISIHIRNCILDRMIMIGKINFVIRIR